MNNFIQLSARSSETKYIGKANNNVVKETGIITSFAKDSKEKPRSFLTKPILTISKTTSTRHFTIRTDSGGSPNPKHIHDKRNTKIISALIQI